VDTVGRGTSWSARFSLMFCELQVGAARFVECALHPLPPPDYGSVVKFSQRCCCVSKPPVIPCRVAWKLQTFRRIVNVSKSRCLTSCLLIRLSITEALNFHDRVNMSLSFFPTQNQMKPIYLFRSLTVHLYLFKIHFIIIPYSAPSSFMVFLSFLLSWQILYTLLISPIPCTFLANLRHQSIARGTEHNSLQL
jgi:hypothetical protein